MKAGAGRVEVTDLTLLRAVWTDFPCLTPALPPPPLPPPPFPAGLQLWLYEGQTAIVRRTRLQPRLASELEASTRILECLSSSPRVTPHRILSPDSQFLERRAHVAQAGLKCLILLPLPPRYWVVSVSCHAQERGNLAAHPGASDPKQPPLPRLALLATFHPSC